MNLREIRDEERPVCPQCTTPMVWARYLSGVSEIYSWDYDCDCIDTDRLKPDAVYTLD